MVDGSATGWFARRRSRLRLGAALALIGAVLVAQGPDAGAWPRPAAGPSQSGGPEILFTFDDGPHERVTAAILDTLAAHGVQAVFFWNGRRVLPETRRVEARRALVDRAVREGHLVANHTINHVHLCAVDSAEAEREIDVNAAGLGALSGLPILLFRAPYGDKCERLRAQLARRGIEHLHWDIDPQEFRHHDPAQTAGEVIHELRNLGDHERAVVLMHDTQPATARALPRILDWLAAENRRRLARGRAPFRVLSGSDLVSERYQLPLVDWATELARAGGATVHQAIHDLVPTPLPRAAAR